MATDPDISGRTNRVEEIIERLDADEISHEEGQELHEEGQELLTEICDLLHEGEGEVIEIGYPPGTPSGGVGQPRVGVLRCVQPRRGTSPVRYTRGSYVDAAYAPSAPTLAGRVRSVASPSPPVPGNHPCHQNSNHREK